MNSIVLMRTEIEDNSIVSARNICFGKYLSNSVIVYNPVKVICLLDDYYEKRRKLFMAEAKDYVRILKEKI